jgi:hypothetical protein
MLVMHDTSQIIMRRVLFEVWDFHWIIVKIKFTTKRELVYLIFKQFLSHVQVYVFIQIVSNLEPTWKPITTSFSYHMLAA